MDKGLYELLIDNLLYKKLGKIRKEALRKVDESEEARVISLSFQKALRGILKDSTNSEDNRKLVQGILKFMEKDDLIYDGKNYEELLAYAEDARELTYLINNRPLTSISSTTLITGNNGPSLESELNREIRTSDSIDLLISFIKFSGFRLIRDALEEFTRDRKLRVITTSYLGASDYKAIYELSKLPNTEVKVSYDVNRTRLHAKCYLFRRNSGFSTAYIGSSNISNPALTSGLEWNLKISQYTSEDAMTTIKRTFEGYWNDNEFRTFNPYDHNDVANLKNALNNKGLGDEEKKYTFFELVPFNHQVEILEDLEVMRKEHGSFKNLVVAATGTGKTMVSAFDYRRFKKEAQGKDKLLFIAHRKEILKQSLDTFRMVLKDYNFGQMWVDGLEVDNMDYVFASVQSLISNDKYLNIPADNFDYIVIDESHHSTAQSYLKILDYFKAKILLGLTATPERMDGKSILPYFDDKIASEIRLKDAIDRKLLCPFHYFCISDPVDLSHLKWSKGGYEIADLENIYTKNKQRLNVILNSLNRYINNIEEMKAIGFCVSIKHGEFMAESFNKMGIPSIALHGETSREERVAAINKINTGEIKCIFTVDLFNEGVDIPSINTILFLRPTESLTVFIQQLGRGLRLHDDKEVLTVLDYVGRANENYNFAPKFRSLIGKSDTNIRTEIINNFPNMPAGCHIEMEKEAMDTILRRIEDKLKINRLRWLMENFPHMTDLNLNLKNFLNINDINIQSLYGKDRFSYIKVLKEIRKEVYLCKNEKDYSTSFSRLSNMNSKLLINFTLDILRGKREIKYLNKREERLLSMVYYSIWNKEPKVSFKDSFKKLLEEDIDVKNEAIEILEYNLEKIDMVLSPYKDYDIPLEIHGEYYRDQITAAFGLSDEKKMDSLREGVKFIKDINTDLLFITLNKNEKDYLPTTMYNDYIINNKLINWESQSTTSIESITGKRYLSRDKSHRVLIFLRENKIKHSKTAPYIFLGEGLLESSRGNKPIEIIWRMKNEIPEKIIRKSKEGLAR